MFEIPMRHHFLSILIVCVLLMCSTAWPAMAADPPTPAVPASTAADWKANPPAAAAAANKQAVETAATAPAPSTWLADAAGWSLGALGLIIAIGKFVPGVGGVVAQLAGGVYDAVVPQKVRDAEERRDQMAAGLMTAVHVIDQQDPDSPIQDLKAVLQGRLQAHPLAAAAINQWITAQEAAGTRPLRLSASTPLALATAGTVASAPA